MNGYDPESHLGDGISGFRPSCPLKIGSVNECGLCQAIHFYSGSLSIQRETSSCHSADECLFWQMCLEWILTLFVWSVMWSKHAFKRKVNF